MNPSRELDALVAEKVMGYRAAEVTAHACGPWGEDVQYKTQGWVYDGKDFSFLPEFSTDITAAWQVVEKLRGRFLFQLFTTGEPGDEFACEFYTKVIVNSGHRRGDTFHHYSESAPHAISLAALKAVGHEF